jgi:hypothetical protein
VFVDHAVEVLDRSAGDKARVAAAGAERQARFFNDRDLQRWVFFVQPVGR